eukprot:CAMPEP_0194206606 /NCGR_PEP_ID=MMETSP0156-20130528/5581_1 /TAXON_ID=33649 /ORGANISM="Thalassionema nitzschioides, Strain L26-B" /LENGTH=818 /DNA_ID=CAMNT_0038933165 /DNA_START=52 /DNA_END=2508 /DNA_ORIENTATION=-
MQENCSERTRLLQKPSHLDAISAFILSKEENRLKLSNYPSVGTAAFLIRDAALGLVENPSAGAYDPYSNPEHPHLNALSVICRRICSKRPFQHFIQFHVIVLLFLAFFEPPKWCRYFVREGEVVDMDYLMTVGRCEELMEVSGPKIGSNGTEIVEYYPNFHVTFLTIKESQIIELFCLTCLWVYFLLRVGNDGLSLCRYFRAGPSHFVRVSEFFGMFILSFGIILDFFTTLDVARPLKPYLRLLLFIVKSRLCLREVRTLMQMIPEVFNVLILLMLFTGFYAWIGVVLFYGSEEGRQMFPNLIDGMWTLWIATTTANYPDLMMPAYNDSRVVAIYFILYMVVTFFFLMNVILASVVNAYDNELDQRREVRDIVNRKKLSQAFDLMEGDVAGGINREIVMALFLILNEDFPELRTIPEDEAKLLFAILDRDGSGTISKKEFLEFGNVLLLEFEKVDSFKPLLKKCAPRIYNSRSFQGFKKFIESKLFDSIIDTVLVLNAIVVFIQSYDMLLGVNEGKDESYQDGTIDTTWEFLEAVFTLIYVVEMMVKLAVKGWHEYIRSKQNIFDMVITLLAVISTVYVYCPNDFSDSHLIRFIVMARVLRLVRLLVGLTPFQLIGMIGIDVLGRSKMVLLLLFCVCYFFAALGVQLFGGMITRDPADARSFLLLGTEFAEHEYWANNFNDMLSAMNVIFNLLVVNNWTECQDGFEAATQSRWNRFYFFFFHVVGVILANNLVLAFIINAFINQWDFRHEKLENSAAGNAFILGRKAMFNASEVTGTTTDLDGVYTAKLRTTSTQLLDEQHQHQFLQNTFTSTVPPDQ